MSLYRELPPDADLGLTVGQAALLIGCSESRVRKLLRRKNGGLRGYKDGRSVRIYLSSVDEYRSARQITPTTEETPTFARRTRAVHVRQTAAIARLRSLGLRF